MRERAEPRGQGVGAAGGGGIEEERLCVRTRVLDNKRFGVARPSGGELPGQNGPDRAGARSTHMDGREGCTANTSQPSGTDRQTDGQMNRPWRRKSSPRSQSVFEHLGLW
jgi:hypothetical protein